VYIGTAVASDVDIRAGNCLRYAYKSKLTFVGANRDRWRIAWGRWRSALTSSTDSRQRVKLRFACNIVAVGLNRYAARPPWCWLGDHSLIVMHKR